MALLPEATEGPTTMMNLRAGLGWIVPGLVLTIAVPPFQAQAPLPPLDGAPVTIGQAPAGDAAYWDSVTAAARELSRQLNQLQWAFPGAPGENSGRGLYKQTDDI